jgi:AraC-like DNA-binding protein
LKLTDIFFAFAGGSSILLSFLFLLNITQVNVIANKWLSAFYFCLAATFCQLFIHAVGLLNQAPFFVHILELTNWAMLPCFYIAVLYYVNPAKKPFWVLLHFLPAFGFLVFSLLFIIPRFFDASRSLPELPFFAVLFLRYFFEFQVVVYWLLSFRQLIIHSRNIRLISSSIDNISLLWIKHLLFAMLFMTIVLFASKGNALASQISPLIYCVGVFFIGYFSLKQGVIYPVKIFQSGELGIVLNERRKPERLTDGQVSELKTKVTQITESKKLYLDPYLNLPALSAEVGISTHELSYVLNTGLNQNFYQFINEMRVEEAKRILLSAKAKQLDMVGIATHAGFNSKTTFNTTFKKLTGQTPTEFLRANPSLKS